MEHTHTGMHTHAQIRNGVPCERRRVRDQSNIPGEQGPELSQAVRRTHNVQPFSNLVKAPTEWGSSANSKRDKPNLHSAHHSQTSQCRRRSISEGQGALCSLSLGSVSPSVVSGSLRPLGLQPTRRLCPWDSLGRNTGVGSHSLLQGIFPTQGSNSGLLHCRRFFAAWDTRGAPQVMEAPQNPSRISPTSTCMRITAKLLDTKERGQLPEP